MTVSILIFTVALLGFNIVFAKKIYISHKKDILVESSEKIRGIIGGYAGPGRRGTPAERAERAEPARLGASAEFELSRLERIIGGSIFVGTFDGSIYYPAESGQDGPVGQPRMNPFFAGEAGPPPDKIKSYEIYADKSFFMITEDPSLNFETLRFQTRLDSGLEILIWLPMPEISESIAVFNKIVALTALAILVGSVAWSLFVSGKFAKPIGQMNKIAKKISMQDFSQRLEVTGNDELAELSGSINEISRKLSSSISRLSEKNLRLETEIGNEKKLEKMRREFVAGVSHELKTPIFLIQGYAEGLKEAVRREDRRDFYCDVIMSETEKMDRLLKDLLDLAQMEAGMFVVRPQVFDVAALSKNALRKFQPALDSQKISVESDFPAYLAVRADPARTEQVVVNFISNAIDHLDGKRKIRVAVTPDAEAGKARISVYNSGESIPGDELGKLWTPFYKADKSRTREHGGTGLGLSIVKAIQDGHKGGYGAANAAGGVEFWVTLDLAEGDAPSLADEAPDSE
jgi:signal transduction histidine kinase